MKGFASPVGRIWPEPFQLIIAAAAAGMSASMGLFRVSAATVRIFNLNMMV
jgi:hypothetical protein